MSSTSIKSEQVMRYDLVVVGGGIAGVTCLETLAAYCEESSILLITASPVVKAVTNFVQASDVRESFDVEEKLSCYLEERYPNVKVIRDMVTSVDGEGHSLSTEKGLTVCYKKVCLCSGGKPKLISENPYVIGIRDTESVKDLQTRLGSARRVALIGNGGIATEFVYNVCDIDVVWCVKDSSISAAFVDAGAAEFFLPLVSDQKATEASASDTQPRKRHRFTQSKVGEGEKCRTFGEALGPDWHESVSLKGGGSSRNVEIEYKVEIGGILTPEEYGKLRQDKPEDTAESEQGDHEIEWPVYVKLTNGKIHGCDFVVSATGVTPNTDILGPNHKFELSDDGGILVNDKMRTDKFPDVYAAGDVVAASWQIAKHWHQMRLWTQARQMGFYAGKCIHADLTGDELLMDICFDLFAHSTKFFGFKVILLGLFNAQKLGNDYELLLRVTKGVEYVKVVLQNGRMQGAILIGETDLEETFEHLILNETDLTRYGEDLLNPDIDIEDYFD